MTVPEGAGTPPAPQAPPAPPAAPPAPADPPSWQGPSQAEWEAAQSAQQRINELLGQLGGTAGAPAPKAADDEEDDEDEDEAPPNRQAADRTKPPSWDDFDKLTLAMRKAARGERRMRQRVAEWRDAESQRQAQLTEAQKIAEAETKARQQAEAMFRPATIRAASMPALLKAEARGDRLDALFGMIDQTKLGIEGEKVTGLEEQITGLKSGFPEWFAKAPEQQQGDQSGATSQQQASYQRPPAPRVTTGDKPPASTDRPMTTAERMAQQILGGSS